MKSHASRRSIFPKTLWGILALSTLIGLVVAQAGKEGKAGAASSKTSGGKYIGADKCKNCHSAEASGDQYGHWTKSAHAKAYETLGSDKAKEIAKAKGIADPQKSGECMQCHQTAFGVAEEEIKKGFDEKKGVQCETCHGPGEQHMKARFTAAAKGGGDPSVRQTVPADEIVSHVEASTCQSCHNDKSPSYKPFCVHKRSQEIAHYDPRHVRTEGKLICGCDGKEGCKHVCDDKCGGQPAPK